MFLAFVAHLAKTNIPGVAISKPSTHLCHTRQFHVQPFASHSREATQRAVYRSAPLHSPRKTTAPRHNTEFGLEGDFGSEYGFSSQINDTASDFDFIPAADFGNESLEQELLPQTSLSFSNVYCVGGGLAIAQYGGKLVVVDLRRAQEQLVYETYMQRLQNCSSVSQQLLFPQILTLSLEEYSLLEENEVEFAALGFDINFCGEGNIEVKGTPADIDADEADMLIYDLLRLLDTPESVLEVRRQKLAATMAQSVAHRVPSTLSNEEAVAILDRLAESNNRSFTPSGKAIMAELSLEDLRNKLG